MAKKDNEKKPKARIGDRWIPGIAKLGKAFKAASNEAFKADAIKAIDAIDAKDDAKTQLGSWIPMLALLSIVKRPGKNRHQFSYASITDAIVNASEGRLKKADLDAALEDFFKGDSEIASLAREEFWTAKKSKK